MNSTVVGCRGACLRARPSSTTRCVSIVASWVTAGAKASCAPSTPSAALNQQARYPSDVRQASDHPDGGGYHPDLDHHVRAVLRDPSAGLHLSQRELWGPTAAICD